MKKENQFLVGLVCFNLAYALLLLVTLVAMESALKFNLILILILLLGGIDYILFFKIQKQFNLQSEVQNQGIDETSISSSHQKYFIEYQGKIYRFSALSLFLFPVGTVVGSFLLIWFFEQPFNFWWHELTAKHTTLLLNIFFNIGARAEYDPTAFYSWRIFVPDGVGIYIITGCTGAIATSIFGAFILFSPPSQDPATRKDIAWRKMKDFFFTFIAIYFTNLIRMVVLFYLYHLGLEWELIHDSVAKISAVVAVHVSIFWFCNKFIPEWYISIYYSGVLVYRKLKIIIKK